jgi:hypothetical protein
MFTVVQRWLLAFLYLMPFQIWAADQDYERPAMELVTYNEIIIDRPASDIWPYIVAPAAWKQGAKQELVSGEPGKLGAIYRAFLPAKPNETLFYSEDVELVPNQVRSIKIYPPAQGALTGYSSWRLRAVGESTRVSYHVLSEFLLPAEAAAMPDAALSALQEKSRKDNQQRFQRELEALKRLVENESNKR